MKKAGTFADDLAGFGVDIVGLAGAASVTYGFFCLGHPLGFIVGGFLALTGAWLVARRSAA